MASARACVMSRYSLIVYVVATLLVAVVGLTGVLDAVGHALSDARFALKARAPTGAVVLVDIDAASLAAIGTWPWSRAVHGAIIDRLREADAGEIAMDIDFSARSTPEGDAALEAALQRADGSVILAALQQRQDAKSAILVENRPLARFAQSAWEGTVTVEPDRDGRVRRYILGERFGSSSLPSIPSLLAAPGGVAEGTFGIDFSIDASRFDHVSVADLLAGRVERSRIAGKKVIVGATAIELRDYFSVPQAGYISGPLLQAMATETLLQGRSLQPAPIAIPLAGAGLVLTLFLVGRRRLRLSGVLIGAVGAASLLEAAAAWIQVTHAVVLGTAPLLAEILILALVAVATEIEERRLHILSSRAQASRLRIILDRVIGDNFDGIVVVDQDGIVRAASQAALRMLDIDTVEDRDWPYEHLLPRALSAAMDDAMDRARAGRWGSEGQREAACVLSGQREAIVEFVTTSSLVSETAGGRAGGAHFAVCLTFQDVTERRKAETRIAYLAHFDSLTGLANRHAFLAHLEERLAAGRPGRATTAALVFNLDRFKVVNDRLGQANGDALLRSVARRMEGLVTEGDVTARLGGDEFAVLIERASGAAVEAFAHALVQALGNAYTFGPYQASLGVSLGGAIAEDGDGGRLMRRADAALSAAKTAGGSGVRFFDAALDAVAAEERALEDDLRDAVRREEFAVVYQRQVATGDEAIVGVEALVRWRHPRLGPVSPARFIPAAERTGLIEEIGAWVLRQACRDAAGWPLPIKVSVNLSAVQLSRGDLAATVEDALRGSGLAPKRLDLELTESLLMENDGVARTVLERLRGLGIGLSLDDFGTGYSSLSYLRHFAIDKVKIDQSFVRDLPGDQASAAIIRAVVSLAQSLGLRVNAEGCETADQMAMLRLLGCDEVQGFLHGRPEPAEAIAASLLRQAEQAGVGELRRAG